MTEQLRSFVVRLSALILLFPSSGQAQGKAVLESFSSGSLTVVYYPGLYVPQKIRLNSRDHLYFPEAELSQTWIGLPPLPLESFLVGIPPGSKPSLTILAEEHEDIHGILLAPAPAIQIQEDSLYHVVRIFPDREVTFVEKDEAAAQVGAPFWLRYQRVAKVTIYPFRYDAKSGTLRKYKSLRLQIRFQDSRAAIRPAPAFIDAKFEDVYRSSLVNYEQSKGWRQTLASAAGAADSSGNWFNATNEYLKIPVGKTGLYQVPFTYLQFLGTVPSQTNLASADLFYQGISLPFRITGDSDGNFNSGDTLEFFGAKLADAQGTPNQFSDTSAYWFTFGGSGNKRTVTDSVAGGFDVVLDSFLQVTRAEKDSFYFFGDRGLPTNNQTELVPGEGWYWRKLIAPQSTDIAVSTINLYRVGDPFYKIKGKLHSPVFQQSSPNHDIQVLLNGAAVGNVEFGGYSDTVFVLDVPSTMFADGTNVIRLSSLPTGASLNEIFIDWVEVECLKTLTAENDALLFYAGQASEGLVTRFDLSGFSSPDISTYRIGGEGGLEKLFVGKISGTAGNYGFSFTDTVRAQKKYLALTGAKKKNPPYVLKKTFVNLRSNSNGADYLLVSARELSNAANQLATYRSQNGIGRAKVVFVEDIYDEFSFGHFAPFALQSFLRAADTLWSQPKPTFVVLFGDANWDYKDNLQTGRRNLVPSPGNPVSDAWLVESIGNRFLPDKVVGRIPVQSQTQASSFANMIIAYESSPGSLWNKRYLFMAAGFDSVETARFSQFSEQLISQYIVPDPIGGVPLRMYRTGQPLIGMEQTEEVKRTLSDGGVWINFYGHAGANLWGNGINSADQLRNREGKKHLISDISCSTVRFAEPQIESFGEKLVTDPEGAVAYIGSSGFGYETPLRFLADRIYRQFSQDTVRELGKLLLNAKIALWQTGTGSILTQQALQQLTLLGDPALKLAVPTEADLAASTESLSLIPALPSEADPQVSLTVPVFNLGLAVQDSFTLALAHSVENEVPIVTSLRFPVPKYTDTLTITRPEFKRGGLHQMSITLDANNEVVESSESNNGASISFFVTSGELAAIAPISSSGVHPDSVRLVIQNPNIASTAFYKALFEIDTSKNFVGPGKIRQSDIALGTITTFFSVPSGILADTTVYFWRARLYSGIDSTAWVEGYFLTQASSPVRWIQDRQSLFLSDSVEQISVGRSLQLLKQRIPVSVYSAGFSDGNDAAVYLRGSNISVGVANRGYNVAVLDRNSGNLESFAAFSIYTDFPDTLEAEPLIQHLENITPGKIVLIGIADEGAVNKTERLNLALESVGSAMIRTLGFRDSWAIIGRKGASIGSVLEALSASGNGPVAVVDTLLAESIEGKVITGIIGPARQWIDLGWDADTSTNLTHLRVNLLREFRSGQVDTVQNAVSMNPSLLPDSVKQIRLVALLSSDSAGLSPLLRKWWVDYRPTAELALNYQTVSLQQDTVLEGEPLNLMASVHNIGYSAAESTSVAIDLIENNVATNVLQSFIQNLVPGSFSTVTTTMGTAGRQPKGVLLIQVNRDRQIVELMNSNNVMSIPFSIRRDTIQPVFDVTFDGEKIFDGDYVRSKPSILILVNDNSPLPITDPNSVILVLNGRRIQLGSNPDSLFESTPGSPKVRVVFMPQLGKGSHTLSFKVQDASGNFADTTAHEIRFRVETVSRFLNVVNIPNPMRGETFFTFNLTGSVSPEQLRVKIYTVGGRLVYDRTIDASELRVGFNRIRWDGRDQNGDLLANGVYFYKLSMSSNGATAEVVEKLAILR